MSETAPEYQENVERVPAAAALKKLAEALKVDESVMHYQFPEVRAWDDQQELELTEHRDGSWTLHGELTQPDTTERFYSMTTEGYYESQEEAQTAEQLLDPYLETFSSILVVPHSIHATISPMKDQEDVYEVRDLDQFGKQLENPECIPEGIKGGYVRSYLKQRPTPADLQKKLKSLTEDDISLIEQLIFNAPYFFASPSQSHPMVVMMLQDALINVPKHPEFFGYRVQDLIRIKRATSEGQESLLTGPLPPAPPSNWVDPRKNLGKPTLIEQCEYIDDKIAKGRELERYTFARMACRLFRIAIKRYRDVMRNRPEIVEDPFIRARFHYYAAIAHEQLIYNDPHGEESLRVEAVHLYEEAERAYKEASVTGSAASSFADHPEIGLRVPSIPVAVPGRSLDDSEIILEESISECRAAIERLTDGVE